MRGLPNDSPDTRVSKTLAYLLRHGAEKEGLPMREDGYVKVSDILSHHQLSSSSVNLPYLHHLVNTNAKQRFTLIYALDPTPEEDQPKPKKKQQQSKKRPPRDAPAHCRAQNGAQAHRDGQDVPQDRDATEALANLEIGAEMHNRSSSKQGGSGGSKGRSGDAMARTKDVGTSTSASGLAKRESDETSADHRQLPLQPVEAPEVPAYEPELETPSKQTEDDLGAPDPFASTSMSSTSPSPSPSTPSNVASKSKKPGGGKRKSVVDRPGSNEPQWFIRAAQGHSIQSITTEHLEEITVADDEGLKRVGEMVHGTRSALWDVIRENGLSRVNRQHIHLATARSGSASGPRSTSDLFIYLSLPTLLSQEPSIRVFVSSNNVVLTPGNSEGIIPAHLFHKVVVRRRRGRKLNRDDDSKAKGDETEESLAEWDEVIWLDGQPVTPAS